MINCDCYGSWRLNSENLPSIKTLKCCLSRAEQAAVTYKQFLVRGISNVSQSKRTSPDLLGHSNCACSKKSGIQVGLRLFHKIIVPGELSEVQLASDRTSGKHRQTPGTTDQAVSGVSGWLGCRLQILSPTLNFQPAAKLVIPRWRLPSCIR